MDETSAGAMSFSVTSLAKRWRSWPWAFLSRSAASATSGFLLYASFPGLERSGLVWIALIPLLLLAFSTPPRQAFAWGFCSGFIYWACSISWMLCLGRTSPTPWFWVIAGLIFLAAYAALYIAAFSLTVSFWVRRWGLGHLAKNTLLTLGVPILWAGFEYLRAILFAGFPWTPLGASQFRNLSVIQISQWTGAYGVSALIVLINTSLAVTAVRYRWIRAIRYYRPHPELFVGIFVLLFCIVQLGYGLMRSHRSEMGNALIAVVQPNIPQTLKWSAAESERILQVLHDLTLCAVRREHKPDLVVWPETAVPDVLRSEEVSWPVVQRLATNGVPLLIGSMDYESWTDETRFYNSSFLVEPPGRITASYAKQRLVPMGEYVPLEGIFPFLARLSPLGWTCTPGRQPTVFQLARRDLAFSVLICFEDVFPDISRRFVRGGARLLINQTNDAWLDPSAAAIQHLSHSVFRAVENRVPVVRSANTGVSGFIDRDGHIYSIIAPGPNGIAAAGISLAGVFVPDQTMPLTAYTRYGDWLFAAPAAFSATALLVLSLILLRQNGRKTTNASRGDAHV
jgi:apolipoprotein N-acyltransferase